MQILKVMNNSLILAVNDSGNQCILMGKGIGYKKSHGQNVLESEVEKIFILKDKTLLKNFVQLASELDDTYFNIVKEIIEYATKEYNIEVMDYLYVSLSDHIAFAVNRYHEGRVSEKFNYIEVVKYHQKEYGVGKYAVQLINQTLGVELPESEASAIGLHFVNARLNSESYNQEVQVFKLIDHIEAIVKRKANASFEKDSLSYSRFVTHLKYFAERIIKKQVFEDTDSDILYDQLSTSMVKEHNMIESIAAFVKQKHEVDLTKQEKIYLIIHIHRILGGSR
ncbi:PRD domain-containing protein [Bacillus mesophilum]|uniref:PRD domain-containing protein n=1 Tax=Bacillus mesophilum TaxID=1071718 RepID=A0A7V7RIZ7_9BACI|nr:PRD domain-containing protein [Bacillus mesophilum]KAB2330357.1 PRD domain-containing protein [Bacillus mesophilum]